MQHRLGWERKKIVILMQGLINTRVEEALEGRTVKDLKEIDLN